MRGGDIPHCDWFTAVVLGGDDITSTRLLLIRSIVDARTTLLRTGSALACWLCANDQGAVDAEVAAVGASVGPFVGPSKSPHISSSSVTV